MPEGYNGLDIAVTYNQNKVELTKPENIYEYGDEGDTYIDAYTFVANEAGMYQIAS